jgi:hypothetical protein
MRELIRSLHRCVLQGARGVPRPRKACKGKSLNSCARWARGVIDLGGFEVLGREDVAAFDYAFYEKYRPFREHPPDLRATNFGDLKSVFFIVCSSELSRRSDGFIVITDVMSVTFDWEA